VYVNANTENTNEEIAATTATCFFRFFTKSPQTPPEFGPNLREVYGTCPRLRSEAAVKWLCYEWSKTRTLATLEF
jgi:hypothetical protein